MIDAGRGNRLFKGANQNPRLQPPRNVQSEEYSEDVSAIHWAIAQLTFSKYLVGSLISDDAFLRPAKTMFGPNNPPLLPLSLESKEPIIFLRVFYGLLRVLYGLFTGSENPGFRFLTQSTGLVRFKYGFGTVKYGINTGNHGFRWWKPILFRAAKMEKNTLKPLQDHSWRFGTQYLPQNGWPGHGVIDAHNIHMHVCIHKCTYMCITYINTCIMHVRSYMCIHGYWVCLCRGMSMLYIHMYINIWCVAMHENTYAVNDIFTYDTVEEVDFIDAHNACIFILI